MDSRKKYFRRIRNVEIQEIAYWDEINGENKTYLSKDR